jgi:hypothetical protein
MKRITTIILSFFIIFMISVASVSAQKKKSEQKIKIVVSDGSGIKVVIDTLIKDGNLNDSINLKDGKVIYIGKPDDLDIVKHQNGPEHVWVSASEEGNREKIIYINEAKASHNHMDKIYNVRVEGVENEGEEYSTRSIVAKDGIVVTVEGNDETKVKELVKEIQQKMGVTPPASDKKETVKTESKKAPKK